VSEITSELDLSSLLQRIMGEATRMLKADRSTLFLNDEKTGELFARVAQGDGLGEIRFPNTAGIAGTVFQTGESINIPYAYADLQNMKNYNDAMLESMSNGILTLDEDGRIATCNAAGARILRTSEDVTVGESAGAVFAGVDSIVMDMITRVEDSQQTELAMDV